MTECPFFEGRAAALDPGVSQIFGLESGDIDAAGAFTFAGFATKTEVECGESFGIVPDGSAVAEASLNCLAQGIPAAAGAVAFVERGAIAGAHGSAGGFAAEACAIATVDSVGEIILVGVVEKRIDG